MNLLRVACLCSCASISLIAAQHMYSENIQLPLVLTTRDDSNCIYIVAAFVPENRMWSNWFSIIWIVIVNLILREYTRVFCIRTQNDITRRPIRRFLNPSSEYIHIQIPRIWKRNTSIRSTQNEVNCHFSNRK